MAEHYGVSRAFATSSRPSARVASERTVSPVVVPPGEIGAVWGVAATASADAQQEYAEKLGKITGLIAGVDPDLVGVQEVLASRTDLTPRVFADFRSALTERTGTAWNGILSRSPDSRGIRVGWLSRGRLAEPVEVAGYPAGVPPVVVDDAGTTIGASKRGALAVTSTHSDGSTVSALTAHFKSKLLTFPGRAGQPRYDTDDEGERARYGLYALAQRAAEAATVRAWATNLLEGANHDRRVLVCGDLNDTPQAATTQILLGPPGSQLGTGGFSRPDRGDGNRLWNLAPAMPSGNPETGEEPANWSRINNGVPELIDQILVSHALIRTLDSTQAVAMDGVRSVTADPASLSGMTSPSDHRPVIARFNL